MPRDLLLEAGGVGGETAAVGIEEEIEAVDRIGGAGSSCLPVAVQEIDLREIPHDSGRTQIRATPKVGTMIGWPT